jgi:hypothetical protein
MPRSAGRACCAPQPPSFGSESTSEFTSRAGYRGGDAGLAGLLAQSAGDCSMWTMAGQTMADDLSRPPQRSLLAGSANAT